MKILVINLLRLGDVVMNVPVINGLRARRADAQIDMLTFKPASALHVMLPKVNRWWTIDRDELQDGLGRADVPMLASFSVLKEQLDAINAEKYDLIINLTQTKFSAYVAGYLKAGDRLGLTYDLKGLPHFYSPWFRYLDERADGEIDDVFHHTDIFAHACGIGEAPRDWTLKVTAKGRDEVEALNLGTGEVIALQLFTSDEKKNWPVGRWLDFVHELKAHRPTIQIVALGAPNERERLLEFTAMAGTEIIPAVLSLEGAVALLHRAKLLLTGDTSIKHLANSATAKVIELSLGWSDYRRTGVYKENSLIVTGEIDAADLCATSLAFLRDDWRAISHCATRLKIRRSRELSAGFWYAQDLSAPDAAATVETLVERCAWKITLNRERQKQFSEFGSEGVALRRELRALIGDEKPVLAHLDFLEKTEEERGQALGTALNSLKRERPPRESLMDIAGFRKRQIELEFAFTHIEHKTKLIRTLKTNWTENL